MVRPRVGIKLTIACLCHVVSMCLRKSSAAALVEAPSGSCVEHEHLISRCMGLELHS